MKQRTARDRFRRALRRLGEWCRWHRHDPLKEQHRALTKKLKGHYAYYGITSNLPRISSFYHQARRTWRGLSWEAMLKLLERFPLPAPRIVHRYGT